MKMIILLAAVVLLTQSLSLAGQDPAAAKAAAEKVLRESADPAPAAQEPNTSGARDPAKTEIPKLVAGGEAFSADLYGRLAAKQGNLFFSPSSIRTALAMTYAGAAGDTAGEMARTLQFALTGDALHTTFAAIIAQLNAPPKAGRSPAYELVISNDLWGQRGYPFKADFTQRLKKDYGAELNQVDFAAKTEEARKAINDAVAGQTRDKIKDLIGPGVLDKLTRLVLTNAIYFKSNWDEPFRNELTKPEPFKLSPEKSVDVPMMHQQKHFENMETGDFQVLELPYKMNQLAMVIFLPRKADGLKDFEKSLTAGDLSKWLGELKSPLRPRTPAPIAVTLPKFTFADAFNLAEALKAMGMPAAFDPVKADFSGMAEAAKTHEPPLFISAVIHKAFVAVDEQGTEAAAATAVAMRAGAARMPIEPKIFKADHPFVFLIRHNATGEILFMGRLTNPKE